MEDDETLGTITVNIDDLEDQVGSYLTVGGGGTSWDNMTASYTYPTYSIANGGTGAISASNYTYNAYANATIANTTFNSGGGLTCNGPAEFKGDVTIDGVSVKESLSAIEKRLAILVPDPKKLEKFEALKKAYDHYKVMEAMCYGDDDG